jgi:membrane carboxypeptidase/penicillin-binding protein PbpC
VLLRQALASSYNLVAVKVLDYIGIEAMTDLARSLGITTFDDVDRFGLALTLGGGEVRLLELTAAYSAFANGGYQVEPVTITRVENSQGAILKTWPTQPGPQVMDERVAYLVTDILSDNFARASAFGEGSPLHLLRPAAAKTGTTTDWRDNWTVGYTPDLAVGVWAGNADNEPMRHVTGVMGAAPIWHDVMETILRGRPVREFPEPPGMVRVEVCADSGLLPWKGDQGQGQESAVASQSSHLLTSPSSNLPTMQACPRTISELFIAGTEPTRTDDWHWLFTLDARNGLLAGPDCPALYTIKKPYTLYPAEAEDWAQRQSIPQPPQAYSAMCPQEAANAQAPATDPMAYARLAPASTQSLVPYSLLSVPYPLTITSPDQGSRYRLSSEIPKGVQQINVAVRVADGVALRQVTLLADGQPLITLAHPPYQVLWPMAVGQHVFSAVGVDVTGNEVRGNEVTIQVVK